MSQLTRTAPKPQLANGAAAPETGAQTAAAEPTIGEITAGPIALILFRNREYSVRLDFAVRKLASKHDMSATPLSVLTRDNATYVMLSAKTEAPRSMTA